MKPVLQSVLVRFEREGVEIAVSYSHCEPAQPNPGTKTRTRRAARMARAGLQAALEGLDRVLVAEEHRAKALAFLEERGEGAAVMI